MPEIITFDLVMKMKLFGLMVGILLLAAAAGAAGVASTQAAAEDSGSSDGRSLQLDDVVQGNQHSGRSIDADGGARSALLGESKVAADAPADSGSHSSAKSAPCTVPSISTVERTVVIPVPEPSMSTYDFMARDWPLRS